MKSGDGLGRAFWTCAGFTLFSAIVSASFSLLSLRMAGGHEYALYAASRSVALPLAIIYAMTLLRSALKEQSCDPNDAMGRDGLLIATRASHLPPAQIESVEGIQSIYKLQVA
jgi:hypothetical protein